MSVEKTIRASLASILVLNAFIILCYAQGSQSSSLGGRRLQNFGDQCLAIIRHASSITSDGKEDNDLDLYCLTNKGHMFSIPSVNRTFIDHHFIHGPFKSGQAFIEVSPDTMVDVDSHELLLYSPQLISTEDKIERKLTVGTRTVLIVGVTTSNASPTLTEAEMTDNILGTFGDSVTMSSQYEACSHGKLTFEAVPNRSGITTNISSGVVSITVSSSTSNSLNVITNEVTTELFNEFGENMEDLADHIMMCLPLGVIQDYTTTINSYLTTFSGDNCSYLSVGMKAIGGNLNFASSNTFDAEGGDQSGVMGTTFDQSDGPLMCFNAAKLWQTGWFSSRTLTMDVDQLTTYTGPVADMTADPDDTTGPPIIIKVLTLGPASYFLNYNRANGFNVGTTDGPNEIRINYTITGGGETFEPSLLVISLGAGESWFSDKDVDGNRYYVQVGSDIDALADVTIEIVPDGPTVSPTSSPTSPTASPTMSPTSPTVSPTKSPTSPTAIPTKSPTSPTASPTKSPTSPIASPTKSPTSFTVSPTLSQTESPSSKPTSNSTSFPTVIPLSLPTSSPTTTPFTDSPTILNTNPPTSTLTVSPTSTPTVCVDSTLRFLVNKRFRSCSWVAKKNTTLRCSLGTLAIQTMCPLTCGTCDQYRCTDGTKRFKIKETGNLRSCSWVRRRHDKIGYRCSLDGIAATCKSSCQNNHCPAEQTNIFIH